MLNPTQNGSPIGFPIRMNVAQARAGLATAMGFGIPEDPADRLVFELPDAPEQWVDENGDPALVDENGMPLDPTARKVPGSGEPTLVDDVLYMVEYQDAAGAPTRLGDVSTTHLAVTVLDDVWPKVKACVAVRASGDRYLFERLEPVAGMGPISLYTMRFEVGGRGES